MLINTIISRDLIPASIQDTAGNTLINMQELHFSHYPVVDEEGRYKGLVTEDLLQDYGPNVLLAAIKPVSLAAVNDADHFFKAVNILHEQSLSLLPVVDDEMNYEGILTSTILLKQFSQLLSLNMPGALIGLQIDGRSYSLPEINKIAELNDAVITQLNTSFIPESGKTLVTVRLNKTDIAAIVATYQRYEYDVLFYFGEKLFENELQRNYDNLMSYLDV